MQEFDPTKPFEVISPQFDPTKPFEVVNGGILSLKSDLPPLKREKIKNKTTMFGGEPTVIDLPESEKAYKKRLAEYYGFSDVPEIDADNYDKLQEELSFTTGSKEDMQRVIKKAYGPFADLAEYEGYPDPVIKFKSGEIVPFNKPGLDVQDVRGLRGNMVTLGSEFAGGLAGMIGGTAGVVAGVGAGTFTGEVLRLQKGREKGYHDLTNADIYGRAAIDAAITVGLEVSTLGAGAIIRRMIANPAARSIVGDLTEAELDAAIKAADKYAAETGNKLTAGQSIQEAQRVGDIAGGKATASEARTVEEALALSGDAPELKAMLKEQQASLDAGARKIEEIAAPDLLGSEDVGRDIQAAAKEDVAAQAKDIFMEADVKRGIQEDIIQSDIKAPELLKTSEELRTYIQEAKTKTFADLRARYDEFRAATPDEFSVDMSAFRNVVAEWKGRVAKDFIPKMTGEDKVIIEQALGAGLKGGKTTVTPSIIRAPLKIGNVTVPRPDIVRTTPVKDTGEELPFVFRAISQLKEDKRMLDAGLPSQGRQRALLSDFINALEEARDSALRDIDPELRQQLRDIDASYAKANRDIYGSMLGRMISKTKQGGYAINESKLFEKLASEPTEVKNLAALINDPEFSGFGGTSIIKDGFNSLYRDQVIDGTVKHSTFMRKYSASMEEILTPKELKKFDTYQTAQRNIELIDKIEKQEIKNLNNTIGYKLQGYDAEDVLNKVKGSVSKVRDVKRILARSPDKWEDFQRLYARDFLDSVMDEGGFGAEFSAKKLGDKLKSDRGELTEIFGTEHLTNLTWLKNQAEIIGAPKSVRGEAARLLQENPPQGPVMAIWRATIARPLSREGLLTTGAVKLMRKGSRKALGEVLTDPAKLKIVHDLYVKDAPLRKWRSFFRSIGYAEMVDVMQEKDE